MNYPFVRLLRQITTTVNSDTKKPPCFRFALDLFSECVCVWVVVFCLITAAMFGAREEVAEVATSLHRTLIVLAVIHCMCV